MPKYLPLLLLLSVIISLGQNHASGGDVTTVGLKEGSSDELPLGTTRGSPRGLKSIKKEQSFKRIKGGWVTADSAVNVLTKIKDLEFVPCFDKEGPFRIDEMEVEFDENNDIILTMTITTEIEITGPVKGKSRLCKNNDVTHVRLVTCTDIPCKYGLYGSCEFPDLCNSIFGLKFICPIKKGTHRLVKHKIKNQKLPYRWLMFDDYLFEFHIVNGLNETLACYNGKFTLIPA